MGKRVSWMPAFAGMTLFFLSYAALAEVGTTIRVDRAACRYVTQHVPDGDVAYQPGKDVHGNKVVPADLNASSANTLQDTISIKLTNDATKLFGLKVPAMPIKGADGNMVQEPMAATETEIGYVALKHGVAYLNGKPLQPAEQQQLAVLCKKQE